MPPLNWDMILQSGGMSAVAFVLLYFFISDRKEHSRTLKAISVTMVTFQQLIVVVTLSRRHPTEDSPEECKELQASVNEVRRLIEQQRIDLEKVLGP